MGEIITPFNINKRPILLIAETNRSLFPKRGRYIAFILLPEDSVYLKYLNILFFKYIIPFRVFILIILRFYETLAENLYIFNARAFKTILRLD